MHAPTLARAERDFGVPADVYSVTSFSELRRDGLDVVVVMLEDGPEVDFLNGVCEKAGSASTDVILTCAGHQFKVHRFILASRSPFFKDILTNNEETEAEVRWQWKKCFL